MKSLLFTIILSASLFADVSAISNNKKLTKVSQKELVSLYLKKTKTLNGIDVTPIDSKNRELFKKFYTQILKKTPSQLHAYWIKQIYTGTTQPPKKLSIKDIKRL